MRIMYFEMLLWLLLSGILWSSLREAQIFQWSKAVLTDVSQAVFDEIGSKFNPIDRTLREKDLMRIQLHIGVADQVTDSSLVCTQQGLNEQVWLGELEKYITRVEKYITRASSERKANG